MASQKRVHWAVEAVGLKKEGSTGAYTSIHGLQSVGITTTFNLEPLFELGQAAIYENIEDIPDVEVTLEKVLDGYPLMYHLATQGYPSNTLLGRSNQRSILAMSIFNDTNDSSSGTPLATLECSGLYTSSLSYTFPADGNFTESLTLIGNEKQWNPGGSGMFGSNFYTGTLFDNTDIPLSGVQRRKHFIWSGQSNISLLPTQIPGVSSSGTNNRGADGQYQVHAQNISFSADFGREKIVELGRYAPYHRYMNLPVDVTTEIEIIALSGDLISATEAGTQGNNNNLVNEHIKVCINDGLIIDTGTKNKLSNISYGGGEAGGGNATITYSYVSQNEFTVTHPQDPVT